MSLPEGTPVRLGTRPVGAPACHAPFTSMYLDQRGNVRACCMNVEHVLGNIAESRLPDIWQGASVRALRRAMEVDDLGHGCDICKWQVEAGHPELAYARWYDDYALDGPDPAWPRQLELSVSNTCNLQCVMCNGEWSSSIRSQVEGKPPLPAVYDDTFFEDLGPFLPHLERVKFLGGEPFLAGETLRVMEMLVDQGLTTRCHVTTNGTQWSPRVERILSMLRVDVSVSLDAATKDTYESIRRGSSWDQVRRNLDRFLEWSRARDTWVSVTFCLMTVNWREFGDFCRLADELEVMGDVNTVLQPHDLSLFSLETDVLAEVVAGLDEQDEEMRASLSLTRSTWVGEVDKLRSHLAERRREESLVVDPLSAGAPPKSETDWRREHVGLDAPWLDLDEQGVVRAVHPDGAVLGIPRETFLGRHHGEFEAIVERHLGPIEGISQAAGGGGVLRITVALADDRVLHLLSTPAGLAGDPEPPTHLYWAWAPTASTG